MTHRNGSAGIAGLALIALVLVPTAASQDPLLASLAPVTVFFYLTTDNYHFAKLLNGVMFAFATLGAQRTLARHYRPLLASAPRHRVALTIWPALYFFVAAQLAYALRPFVGNPAFPTEFLREDWRGNVYLDLMWAVRGAFG